VADVPASDPNAPSGVPDKANRRKPFSVAQARRELRDAERTLKDYESRNVSGTMLDDAKKAVKDAQSTLKDLTSGSREDRRGARQDFMDEYYNELGGPWVAELIKRDPDLRPIFEKAIRNDDVQGFIDDILQSKWWNDPKKSTSWKAAFQSEYAKDKTAWNTGLTKADELVRAAAVREGVVLTDEQVARLSRVYWYQGWNEDPDAMTVWMQTRASAQRDGAGPDVPVVDDQRFVTRDSKISELETLAEAYGLDFTNPFDRQTLEEWADKILDPKKNVDSIQDEKFLAYLVDQSRSRYGAFADQISADVSLRSLAGGYMQELVRMLEISPADLRLTPTGMDPLLQRALMNIDRETGNPARIPLWEFSKQIRKDERWQYTDNARDSYMSAASKFSRSLGLAG
jgi:hypothetical protein